MKTLETRSRFSRLLCPLVFFFLIPGSAWALGPSFWVNTSGGNAGTPQTIVAVNLSNDTINSGLPAGTTVGTLSAVMSPASPPFNGAFIKSTGGGCASTGNASFTVTGSTVTTASSLAAADYALCIAAQETGVTTKLTSFTIHVIGGGGTATNIPTCDSPTTVGGITLDCTVFTGTQTHTPGGETLVANISGGSGTYTLSGADASRFRVAPAAESNKTQGQLGTWVNSNLGGARRGPFLIATGNPAGQANGFVVCITGGSSSGCFNIGDPDPGNLGLITLLGNGGNIGNALSSAPSGGTVLLTAGGSYSFSGDVPSGKHLVSGTLQHPISGQASRATVNLGGGTISGFVYGINFTNGGNGAFGDGTFINNKLTNQSTSPNNNWQCNGVTGTVTKWNSFDNGSGINDNCGDPYAWTLARNYIHGCGGDCLGGPYGYAGTAADTVSIDFNFFDVDNTGEGGMNNSLGAAVEWGCSHGSNGDRDCSVRNNYILNAGSGGAISCCGGYALSMTGETCTQTASFNYIGGMQTEIEISTHSGIRPSACANVIGNYLDRVNITNNKTQYQNTGIHDTSDNAESGLVVQNNRELGGLNDSNVGDSYIAGPTNNIGIPPPFSAGAGP